MCYNSRTFAAGHRHFLVKQIEDNMVTYLLVLIYASVICSIIKLLILIFYVFVCFAFGLMVSERINETSNWRHFAVYEK